jgi:hypothetical protein
VPADVAGDVIRSGFAGVQAGDDEHRHRLTDMRMSSGGAHDRQGAPLAPPVPAVLAGVLDGHRFPVQGVVGVPDLRGFFVFVKLADTRTPVTATRPRKPVPEGRYCPRPTQAPRP